MTLENGTQFWANLETRRGEEVPARLRTWLGGKDLQGN
jgi:hypothetical protein